MVAAEIEAINARLDVAGGTYSGSISITLTGFKSEIDTRTTPPRLQPVVRKLGTREFEFTAPAVLHVRAVDDAVLERQFPNLTVQWEVVGRQSFDAAVQWATAERTADLRGEQVSLLGVAIAAEDVGQAGPWGILVILLYLATHLWNARRHFPNWQEVRSSSNWIGAMDNSLATCLSFVTLAILPGLATALIAWRLFGWTSILVNALLLPAIAVLGIVSFCIATLVRWRSVER